MRPQLQFEHTYAALGEQFRHAVEPDPVRAPSTICTSTEVCQKLGIAPQWLHSDEGAAFLAGNEILPSSEPVATVYAGHQFGAFSPRLGDGRAHLLGELLTTDGERVDLQLKGSGRTPYSRMGDGRSPLGPALREFIISEAMAALDIPTTRSLGVVSTGEEVRRQTIEPGGIVARVASSHLRVGTFEYFASQNDRESVEKLTEYALERHYPDADLSDGPALALVREVTRRQASLVAQWQLVGFIHGVMNTDNTTISGETIDYGPCAFMNEYAVATVYSSIDTHGRYAFGNQPPIMQWNLSRLATAALALLDVSDDQIAEAQRILESFPDLFEERYHAGLRRKLGLTERRDGDEQLAFDLLARMEAARLDYTRTFRQLAEAAAPDATERRAGPLPDALEKWHRRWQRRVEGDERSAADRRAAMETANPAVIPRNHLVESALAAAIAGDHDELHDLVDVLRRPFDWPAKDRYALPPADDERVAATFCGT